MKVLVLSLGHNSSAILVEDGHIVAGYEEERLSGIKADSTFPQMAILQLLDLYKIPSDIREHSKSHVLSGDIFSAIYFRTIICSICWYIGFIERIIKYIEGTCVDRFKNWVYRNEEYD